MVDESKQQFAGGPAQAAGVPPRRVGGLQDLAIDVELYLAVCRIADPNWPRATVAVEVIEDVLFDIRRAINLIDQLQLVGPVSRQILQPTHELLGLLVEAKPMERVDQDGHVTQPDETVVPVERAADPLRQ